MVCWNISKAEYSSRREAFANIMIWLEGGEKPDVELVQAARGYGSYSSVNDSVGNIRLLVHIINY
jgi:hypothetical protein